MQDETEALIKRIYLIAAMLGVAMAPAFEAWASGAYVVDDADIVDEGKLQVESWYAYSNNGEHFAALNPSYQLLPNTEFSAQMTHDINKGDHTDSISPQVKYQWRNGDDGKKVESSIVVGGGYTADSQKLANYYAYVPATLKLDEVVDVSTNLGWLYSTDNNRNYLTWGLSSELHANPTFSLISEVFGKNEGRAGFELGPHAALSESLELDALYGRNVTGTAGDWFTAGITLTF